MERKVASRAPSVHSKTFEGVESRTKQAFRDGTKLDSILRKYATIGVDPNDIGVFRQTMAGATYGVADTSHDYQVMLNRVNYVQEYFARLPSRIRDRFANDPARMLDFMADKRNIDECVKLGLFRATPGGEGAKPPPEAPPVPPASPAPATPPTK